MTQSKTSESPSENRSVGGFFGLELPRSPLKAQSLWSLWTQGAQAVTPFHNGRGALKALLKNKVKRIWLPSYLCHHVHDTCQTIGVPVLFYPVSSILVPDSTFLEDHIKAGDCVLSLCYFGHPISPHLQDLAHHHPDIMWIEDRAQALHPQWEKSSFDYILYSPRKLLGVPDGALVITQGRKEPPSYPSGSLSDFSFMIPALWRWEDQEGKDRSQWFQSYQNVEASQKADPLPMSQMTQYILHHTSAEFLMKTRQKNYNFLWDSLKEFCLWSDPTGEAVPFSFPVFMENSSKILEYLYHHKIFAARHWSSLPCPSSFGDSHELSRHLFSLPCDHRYTLKDMKRVVKIFLRAVESLD